MFVDFEEGELCFAPTYKYDTFSDDYDTSEKCRSPAWTDRILWLARQPSDVRLKHYGRAELKTSDHRPVGAKFELLLRKVDDQRLRQVYDEVIRFDSPHDFYRLPLV